MKRELQSKIEAVYANEYCRSIIEEKEFYFQKAKDALELFQQFEVTEQQGKFFLDNRKNYKLLREEYDNHSEYRGLMESLFTFVSYCDLNAYRKQELNEYSDRRVLALANVYMNKWCEHLLAYKFNLVVPEGPVKNAIDYVKDPTANFTMLSDGHREQLVQILFGQKYVRSEVVKNLLDYFKRFEFKVNNPYNYTHLLSRICYSIKEEWKESVIGLLVPDSTGWQSDIAKGRDEINYVTVWNGIRPTGTEKTIKLLREALEENGSFNIYYSMQHQAHYVAEIVDFVTNQNELEQANWRERFGDIRWYSNKFEDYFDDKRRASIIYLAQKFYKIEPIHYTDFTFLGNQKYPGVQHQKPIVSYIAPIEKMEKQNADRVIELLKYKKQIILQGPPGTGKTKIALEIAENICFKNGSQKLREKIDGDFLSTFFKEPIKINSLKNDQLYHILNFDGSVVNLINSAYKHHKIDIEKIDGWYQEFKRQSISKDPEGQEIYSYAIARYIYETVIKKQGLEFCKIVQFHPSYTYEDFVRGIEVKTNEENTSTVSYEPTHRILSKIALDAEENKDKNYVLILDEINRANLSAVLGELIYALEYRGEDVESMYSVGGSNKISLPDNLYIVGTMNTADRSVGHIDYAIRRRFAFVDVLPKSLESELNNGFDTELFNKVSKLFVKSYDPTIDYTKNRELLKNSAHLSAEFRPEDVWLGHSYFIKKENATMDMRLEYEIRPILLEYIKDGVLHEEARAHVLALPNEIPGK